jgi:hypothetical protein
MTSNIHKNLETNAECRLYACPVMDSSILGRRVATAPRWGPKNVPTAMILPSYRFAMGTSLRGQMLEVEGARHMATAGKVFRDVA